MREQRFKDGPAVPPSCQRPKPVRAPRDDCHQPPGPREHLGITPACPLHEAPCPTKLPRSRGDALEVVEQGGLLAARRLHHPLRFFAAVRAFLLARWVLRLWVRGSHDQRLVTLILPSGAFLVLGIYKHRGRTEAAVVIDEAVVRPLTLANVDDLAARGPQTIG